MSGIRSLSRQIPESQVTGLLGDLVLAGRSVNVKAAAYGAKGDGIRRTDGVVNATTTFTSSAGTFTVADIGKKIAISSAGATAATTLVTTISAVASPTSITLAVAAGRTGNGLTYTYGTDDSAAINAAITAALVSPQQPVYFPGGLYMCGSVLPSLDNTTDFLMSGAGGITVLSVPGGQPVAITEICYIGSTNAPFLHANDSQGLVLQDLAIRNHTTAITTGLIEVKGTVSTPWPAMGSVFSRCTFGGVDSANVSTVASVAIPGNVFAMFRDCYFYFSQNGLWGTNYTSGQGFCNVVTVTGGEFAYNVVSHVRNPAVDWVFNSVTFEPLAGVTGAGIYSDPGQSGSLCRGVYLSNCFFWDQWPANSTAISVWGDDVRVIGCAWELQATGHTAISFAAGSVHNPALGLTVTDNRMAVTGTSTFLSFPNVTDGSAFNAWNVYAARNTFPSTMTDNSATVPQQVRWAPNPGPLQNRLRTVTAATTLTGYEGVVKADATAGAMTLTLPSAATTSPTTLRGVELTIKKTDSSANLVTVATTSSQTIDGATTYTGLAALWNSVRLVSDGSNWLIVSKV